MLDELDLETNRIHISSVLADLAKSVHARNKKWWYDIETNEPLERNKGELIALMHSELSEMLEGIRKGKNDDHLPEFKNEVVEAADLLIRLLDYIGGFGLDLGPAFFAKLDYNATRADHTHKARREAGGKKF